MSGTDFAFRRTAVSTLTQQIGVYVLADLDDVPIYVGQSKDGIRSRVQRHLTSARSDIIANKQIDVWEIGFVWAYPCPDKDEISQLENFLFHQFDPVSQLMNGKIPPISAQNYEGVKPSQTVQVMTDHELLDKKSPEQRLPRQASHYAAMVDHFLTVKNAAEISRAMDAHFSRLQRYHQSLQDLSG